MIDFKGSVDGVAFEGGAGEDYPLVLTTGARIPFYFNSEHRQIAKLRKAYRDPRAEIHPQTARHYDIDDGDWMWIETRRGRMQQRAKVTTRIDPRVIAAYLGVKDAAETPLT